MVQFRHVIVQLALAIDKRKVAGYEYNYIHIQPPFVYQWQVLTALLHV